MKEELKAVVERAGFKYDVKALGELIGQFFAESSKNGKLIDFSNKLISEHVSFLRNAEKIGLPPAERWRAKLQYNPKRIDKEERDRLVKRFSLATGINRIYLVRMTKGNYCFLIELWNKPLAERFTLLSWSILNLMAEKELKGELRTLAEHFFAKLLAGDGYTKLSLAGRASTEKRRRIRLRVNIGEGNPELRKLYKKIIEKLGIRSRIYDKSSIIVLNTNWKTLLKLYRMQAFKGHPRNRARLIYALLEHPKTKYLYKRLRLARNKPLCSEDLVKPLKNDKRRRNKLWVALRWLKAVSREGYLTERGKRGRYILFELTGKGRRLLETIEQAIRELNKSGGIKGELSLSSTYMRNNNDRE